MRIDWKLYPHQVLAPLLYHVDWKLPNGMKNVELELTEEFGITISRKGDLHLIPITSHQLLSCL